MEATELRLGNKIYSNELDIDNGCEVLQIVDCDYYAIHEILRGNKVNKYSPIPITEKLLLTIGFQNRPEYSIYGFINEFGRFSIWLDGRFKIESQDIPKSIKYLHELQNVYFALTGSELSLSGI